jgi:glycosyltransferase involved in cell wall biosynthesis
VPERLVIVIPVRNQRAEIGETLTALAAAVEQSSFDAQVVVVDDGSTDGTADAVRGWSGGTVPVRLIEQANAGRFAARLRGLQAVDAEYALLMDSRVGIDREALAFVEAQLAMGESKEVWNAHVDIVTSGNPFGVFWDVLTQRAFSAYFDRPRTTSFGLADFERFPKGTTCFFAPRALLLDAFAAFRTRYSDIRHANDDTPVIRWLAARRPINISPSFSCRYAARQRPEAFVRHAYHRGTVFVDGHGRRESRFFPAVIGFYPVSAAWAVGSFRAPWLVVAPLAAAAAAGAGAAAVARRPDAIATMAWTTPLYAVAHGAGMWRGLWLLTWARARRSRA